MEDYEWVTIHWDERLQVESLIFDEERGWPVEVQKYHRVTVEDTDLRFIMSLTYSSHIIFLCPICDEAWTPSWFAGPSSMRGCSVLSLTSKSAACVKCKWRCSPELLSADREAVHRMRSFHAKVHDRAELRGLMSRSLDVLGTNVLSTVIIADEIVEVLGRMKGRAMSEHISSLG